MKLKYKPSVLSGMGLSSLLQNGWAPILPALLGQMEVLPHLVLLLAFRKLFITPKP